jgi:hypothetical protein
MRTEQISINCILLGIDDHDGGDGLDLVKLDAMDTTKNVYSKFIMLSLLYGFDQSSI